MTFDRKTYNREWRRRKVAEDPTYRERVEYPAMERYRAKKLPILLADPNHPDHGKEGSYILGCRCEACKRDHAAKEAVRRERRKNA